MYAYCTSVFEQFSLLLKSHTVNVIFYMVSSIRFIFFFFNNYQNLIRHTRYHKTSPISNSLSGQSVTDRFSSVELTTVTSGKYSVCCRIPCANIYSVMVNTVSISSNTFLPLTFLPNFVTSQPGKIIIKVSIRLHAHKKPGKCQK